jgi:hypothetical protein
MSENNPYRELPQDFLTLFRGKEVELEIATDSGQSHTMHVVAIFLDIISHDGNKYLLLGDGYFCSQTGLIWETGERRENVPMRSNVRHFDKQCIPLSRLITISLGATSVEKKT